MQEQDKRDNLPLIIYLDDDGTQKTTYSTYDIKDGVITFTTQRNILRLPLSRLIKIKEGKE